MGAVADLTDEAQTEAAFARWSASTPSASSLAEVDGRSATGCWPTSAAWEATIRLNLTTAFLTA